MSEVEKVELGKGEGQGFDDFELLLYMMSLVTPIQNFLEHHSAPS